MARIEVHGGDFRKGIGALHARDGFTLRGQKGEVQKISFCQLTMVDQASTISLSIFGASEPLQRDFERAAESMSAGRRLFIARFADARLLLASADQTTFEQICTPRGVTIAPRDQA
jgi:hypothetical protein